MDNLLLISSYSNDLIFKDGDKKLKKWWPAYFIENVFIESNVSFENITKKNLYNIDIIIKDNWETGKIKSKKIEKISKKINSKNVMISTIFDEFEYEDFYKLNCENFFIDFQWFSRIYREIDYNKNFDWKRLFIKVTDQELWKISDQFLEELKKKHTLIITSWSKDLIVFSLWKKLLFEVEKLNNLNDTVWAWDTFFAYFTLNYLDTGNLKYSINSAIKWVNKFLLSK